MRAVIQRVSEAGVSVDGKPVSQIGPGALVLLGVGTNDTEAEADYILSKVLNLRIFEDPDDKMNLSLLDVEGELLVVSQFTLYGNAKKGRRPSFIEAAPPEKANELYEYFVSKAREKTSSVKTGTFQAMMDVSLVNDGPVTILLDSEKNF